MFLNAKFSKNGRKTIARLKGRFAAMLQDVRVYRIKKGKALNFFEEELETAILLVKGAVNFKFEGKKERAKRSSFLNEAPVCLHFSRETAVRVIAKEDSEILVQSCQNRTVFPAKVYREGDFSKEIINENKYNNGARYEQLIIFDTKNAPYSNMVMGEIYSEAGKWINFIPAWQPQPQIHYYRFEREEGFGACIEGEKAYKIKDGSAAFFEGGYTNCQVSAAGYPMYCCFMIRHIEGAAWKKDSSQNPDPRYKHLK